MSQQKTLYQLLRISQQATLLEIISAYQKLAQLLTSGDHGLSHDDADIMLKSVRQAYEILSNNNTRAAYDARLAVAGQSGQPVQANTRLPIPEVISVVGNVRPMRFLRLLNALLKAVVLLLLIGIMLLIYRRAHHTAADADVATDAASKKDREKAILQEYYQENGIRPGSGAEADLLDIAARKAAMEKAAKEREKANQDLKYQQFVNDSRRSGNQVSADLDQAADAAKRTDAYNRQRAEDEKRAQQAAEQARIAKEQEKIQQELNSPVVTDPQGSDAYGQN